MRFYRPPALARWLFPEAVFRIKTDEKRLCLTFDDGPHPDSTPQLLDILDSAGIKALFFCSGKAAEDFPELMNEIITRGHSVGNHGYLHLNGWITPLKRYCEDTDKASTVTSTVLFRPPYGRIGLRQYTRLKQKYRIIFWDLMVYDFDRSLGAERSLAMLNKRIRNGSIIVLHDTPDSTSRTFLKDFLEGSLAKGFIFNTIF